MLDTLTLPPVQRQIVLYVTRHGSTAVDRLVEALTLDRDAIDAAVAALVSDGRVSVSRGEVRAVLGKSRHARTLSAHYWGALLGANRVFLEGEIATLRTAIPMLQFARARMGEFADHGPGHALRVKLTASQLGAVVGLTTAEQRFLRAACLFHDVGNAVERKRHHIVSQETVERLAKSGELPFSADEARLVGLLCRWHRKEYDPERRDTLAGELIRTGLLASILRVADAMDIDFRRVDYTEQFRRVLEFFYPDALPFWISLEPILGVRVYNDPAVHLQVLTREPQTADENMQIAMLRRDLAATTLDWTVQVVGVRDARARAPDVIGECGSALLVFPFDPHSLVMAAISRKHLNAAGYTVELLCYSEAIDDGPGIWERIRDMRDGSDCARHDRLIVIGHRPGTSGVRAMLDAVQTWQAAGVKMSLLSRHETALTRLPQLLSCGAEVALGGDWAYFWGDDVDQADIFWGRIAALYARDPSQARARVTTDELRVLHGVLNQVYTDQLADGSSDDWTTRAERIMARIEANDRAYFAEQADGFVALYHRAVPWERDAGHAHGCVLLWRVAEGPPSPLIYWAMEAAIEDRGRTMEPGIAFTTPYAIAVWSDEDEAEIIAINHWRDEAAIPIRLLYPSHLGPPPDGHETAIRVRLPLRDLEAVIDALIAACNAHR